MAQTGYTPIQLYYSTTAAAVPVNTNLADGELAINITDGKLYYKDNGGTVRLLASNATSAPVLSFSAGTTGFTPSTATTGAITLAGTLATTNGGTGLTSFTSGGAVYATSTSALTTGTLPTTAGGTNLTSFTSGGVVYASSSSALATGSALTFDGANLSVIGSGYFQSTSSAATDATSVRLNGTTTGYNRIQIVNSAGGYYIGANSSAGASWITGTEAYALVVSAPTRKIQFSASTAIDVTFDTTGNVGIGTSSPATKLHVSGAQIRLDNEGATAPTLYIRNTTGLSTIMWSSVGTALTFTTSDSSEKMRITSAGNVGIGTNSPTAKLQLDGTTDATQRIIVGGTGNVSSYKLNYNGSEVGFIQNYQNTEMSIGTTVAASLGFNTNNTQRFVITSAGALGIGATPSYGTSGQVLTSQGSGSPPIWAAGGGGGGSPGGSDTQVQYNSSGSFAGSANFTFNGTGITTGNVNVTSATNPTAGMYYNSTATSGLSFYNTGTLGGSSAVQIYYGRSSMAATTGGIDNPPQQWYGFGSGITPQLTIGSTASLYYFSGHNYRLDAVPYVFKIRGNGRGDNGSYTVPESNGILFIDTADDYGGNASTGRNCIYVNNRPTGFGTSTNGVKVVSTFYGRQNAFYASLKIGDPNGGGQNFGFYAQIDTSAGANDNAAPVGLVIDNALVDNYTKNNGGAQLAIFYDRRDGSATRTAIQFYRNTTSNSVGTIQTTNTATAYNTSSDYRLKENIAPLTGAIEKVLKLKPSTYTWKIDGSVGEGFIAHELQEVIPQAVSGEKDAEKLQHIEVEHAVSEVQDADGNIVSHGKAPVYEERMMPVYQGVDSSFLVATLTAAIQEQQALIVALTARLDALEAK